MNTVSFRFLKRLHLNPFSLSRLVVLPIYQTMAATYSKDNKEDRTKKLVPLLSSKRELPCWINHAVTTPSMMVKARSGNQFLRRMVITFEQNSM